MWTVANSLETRASAEALWAYLADVDNWAVWNDGVDSIELHGPFAPGSEFTMVTGGDEIRTKIVETTAPTCYIDETDMGDVVVRVVHEIAPLPSGSTRLTFRLEVDGPAADRLGPEIGLAISADFPAVMAKLARLAEG